MNITSPQKCAVWIVSVIALMGLAVWPAQAQETTPPAAPSSQAPLPTAAPAEDAAADETVGEPAEINEPVKITVLEVQGLVQVRTDEDQPWQPAKVGMELDQGAEFQTGPLSWVRFSITDDQVITLDRLGTIKVVNAIHDQTRNKVKTDLGLKYGRTRCQVEAAGVEHETTIYSPGNTLSIRGTDTILGNEAPFPAYVHLYRGKINYKDSRGSSHQVAGKADEEHPLAVEEGSQGAADTQAPSTVVVSQNTGQTSGEQQVLLAQTVIGANFGQNNLSGALRETSAWGELRQTITSRLIGGQFPSVAGMLEMVLTWSSVDTDLDLWAVSPNNFALSPYSGTIPNANQTSPDGGVTSADDRNPMGQEVIRWPVKVPKGNYQFGAKYFSGLSSADYTLKVTYEPRGSSPRVLADLQGALSPEQREVSGSLAIPPR